MSIELFLSHADTCEPVLASGLPREAAHEAPEPLRRPRAETHLASANFRNSLRHQRWGLVVPKGDVGRALLERIKPLRELRGEQQGREAIVYEVDRGMGPEQANQWMSRDYWDKVARDEEELPRYLLLLGGPELISWDFQQMLGTSAFVGRLAFTRASGEIDEAGYEAYVDKVLRWERGPLIPAARAIFYSVRDGSPAATCGYKHLMKYSMEIARRRKRAGELPAEKIVTIGERDGSFTSDADLLEDAHLFLNEARDSRGSLVFSMSHGLGVPSRGRWSPEDQRRLQGSMLLCKTGEQLRAEDLRDRPFLAGGLWFFFACFSAGTPAASAYYPWLERLKEAGLYRGPVEAVLSALPRDGQQPFAAALPQAALSNPEGPLGVIGHVDLAWTWSFLEDQINLEGTAARGRHERFQGILRSIIEGGRFGAAHNELAHFFNEIMRTLLKMYEQDAAQKRPVDGGAEEVARRARRADLWMQSNDLSAYVLLGDPAARLPIQHTPFDLRGEIPQLAAKAALPDVASIMGFSARQVAPLERATARDAREMEKAVLAYLRDEAAPHVLADQHGITPEELGGWVEAYQEAGRAALSKLG